MEPHALARMHARGISREQVVRVLRSADTIRQARNPRYKRFEKSVSRNRRLAVIAEETSDVLLVVTAFEM